MPDGLGDSATLENRFSPLAASLNNSPLPSETEEARMPLTEHLGELRTRLIRSLLAILAASCLTYYFSDPIIHFLEEPLLRVLPVNDRQLYYTGVADKFFVYLQVSIFSGMALISPYLLFELWMFIAPALHRRERRFVLPFLFLGSVAFCIGMAFSYFVVIPEGYRFLIEFGSSEEKAIITLKEYFSLTTKLLLGLGLVFEIPVLLALLARFGFVTSSSLASLRKHALVASSIGAAMITPTPDAFTMLLVMVPLYLLYETGIVGVRWVEKTSS